jgi:hypothetical protein
MERARKKPRRMSGRRAGTRLGVVRMDRS